MQIIETANYDMMIFFFYSKLSPVMLAFTLELDSVPASRPFIKMKCIN